MTEHDFKGDWRVTHAQEVGDLTTFSIQKNDLTQKYTVTSPEAKLHLPELAHDEVQDILIGTCSGKVRGDDSMYNVAVFLHGHGTDAVCKGVIFQCKPDVEDTTVGTWTADRKGGDSGHRGCLAALWPWPRR